MGVEIHETGGGVFYLPSRNVNVQQYVASAMLLFLSLSLSRSRSLFLLPLSPIPLSTYIAASATRGTRHKKASPACKHTQTQQPNTQAREDQIKSDRIGSSKQITLVFPVAPVKSIGCTSTEMTMVFFCMTFTSCSSVVPAGRRCTIRDRSSFSSLAALSLSSSAKTKPQKTWWCVGYGCFWGWNHTTG